MPAPCILVPLPKNGDPLARFALPASFHSDGSAGDADGPAALVEAADACRAMMRPEHHRRPSRRRELPGRDAAAFQGFAAPRTHRVDRGGHGAGSVCISGGGGGGGGEQVACEPSIECAIACALVDFRVDIGGPMLRPSGADVGFVCELSRRYSVTTAQAHAAIVVWVVWLEATVQQRVEYTAAAQIETHARQIVEAAVLRVAGVTELVDRICAFWLKRRLEHLHAVYRPMGLPLALVGTTKQPGHFRRTDVVDLRRLLTVDDGQVTVRRNLCTFLQHTLLEAEPPAGWWPADDRCAHVVRQAAALAGITTAASSSPLVAGNDLAAALDILTAAAHRWRGGGGPAAAGSSRFARPPVPLGREKSDSLARFIRRRCGEASVRLDESDAWCREGLFVDVEGVDGERAVTRVLMRSATCTERCRDPSTAGGFRPRCGCQMACVLRCPDDLDPVPFVPECMQGLFDLRDRIRALPSRALPIRVPPAMVNDDLRRLAATVIGGAPDDAGSGGPAVFYLVSDDSFSVATAATKEERPGGVVLPISRGFRFDDLLDVVWCDRPSAACQSERTGCF